tara:strand:+ start:799 stop:1020 length:222 start_codon:yes stop_codon:yes gene_type:complete
MKVRDAITALENIDANEEIVFAFWQRTEGEISAKNWGAFVHDVDKDFNWYMHVEEIFDQMMDIITERQEKHLR